MTFLGLFVALNLDKADERFQFTATLAAALLFDITWITAVTVVELNT